MDYLKSIDILFTLNSPAYIRPQVIQKPTLLYHAYIFEETKVQTNPSSSCYIPDMGCGCNKTPHMQAVHRSFAHFNSPLRMPTIWSQVCVTGHGAIIEQQIGRFVITFVNADGLIVSPEIPLHAGGGCSDVGLVTRLVLSISVSTGPPRVEASSYCRGPGCELRRRWNDSA